MHFPRVAFVDETAALVVLARRGELATAAVAVPALVVEIEVQVLREADPLHSEPPIVAERRCRARRSRASRAAEPRASCCRRRRPPVRRADVREPTAPPRTPRPARRCRRERSFARRSSLGRHPRSARLAFAALPRRSD